MSRRREPIHGNIPAITGQIDSSQAYKVFPDVLQPWRSTIISYGSSFVATTVGFPLDTVKTRMQTHNHFTSYFDCIQKTYLKEGIRGFFRGIWAPLISTSFSKSFSVSLFILVKPYCYDALYGSSDSINWHPFLRNVPVCFLSGCVAGGGVSLFACPFEFTKIYAQISKLVQHSSTEKSVKNHDGGNISTLQTMRQIVKHEGIRGLYSGYKYHFLRDSLSSGIYYSIYESAKGAMNMFVNKNPNEPSQISILLAGGLSGVLCWTLIFPIDTTKSLIQRDVVANILRKDQGLTPLPIKLRRIQRISRRLYRGLGISVTRSFMVNMIFFSVFESAMANLC